MKKLHGFEQNVGELKYKEKTLENVNKFNFLEMAVDSALYRKLWHFELSLPVRKELAKYLIKARLLQQVFIWHLKIYESTTSESTKYRSWFYFK